MTDTDTQQMIVRAFDVLDTMHARDAFSVVLICGMALIALFGAAALYILARWGDGQRPRGRGKRRRLLLAQN